MFVNNNPRLYAGGFDLCSKKNETFFYFFFFCAALPTIPCKYFWVFFLITLRRHHNAQMLGTVIMVMVKMAKAHMKRVELLASVVRVRESAIVKSQEKLVPIQPPINTRAINKIRVGLISLLLPLHKNWSDFSV